MGGMAGTTWSVCCGRRSSDGSPVTKMLMMPSGSRMIRQCVGSSTARRRNVARPHLARWVIRDRGVDAGGEFDVEADLSGRWIDAVHARRPVIRAPNGVARNGQIFTETAGRLSR